MSQLLSYLETVLIKELQCQIKKSDIVILDNKIEIFNRIKISINVVENYFFIELNESVYYSINIKGVISIINRLII